MKIEKNHLFFQNEISLAKENTLKDLNEEISRIYPYQPNISLKDKDFFCAPKVTFDTRNFSAFSPYLTEGRYFYEIFYRFPVQKIDEPWFFLKAEKDAPCPGDLVDVFCQITQRNQKFIELHVTEIDLCVVDVGKKIKTLITSSLDRIEKNLLFLSGEFLNIFAPYNELKQNFCKDQEAIEKAQKELLAQ